MRTTTFLSAFALIAFLAVPVFAQELKSPNGKIDAETMILLRAYLDRKEFCCEVSDPDRCLSGPRNDGYACGHLGGTPFEHSVCINTACVDS